MTEQIRLAGASTRSATPKRGRSNGLYAAAFSALAPLAFTLSGCSKPQVTVGPQTPLTFRLSGSNSVIFFQVADRSGVVWKVLPNSDGLTLDEISTARYGKVPASCRQMIPSDAAPPPTLVEGETYHAVASIFDSDAARVSFTIKDGRVVELTAER